MLKLVKVGRKTVFRGFSSTVPPAKSELKIQYEKAEFGVNTSPKEFS